jgi:hypothetical protein
MALDLSIGCMTGILADNEQMIKVSQKPIKHPTAW